MAGSIGKSLSHNAYTVALICPLEVEMSAARFMLDREHRGLSPALHDPNQYVLGELSGHNVVIASLPEGYQDTASAAAVAVHVARTFPSVILRLLVGIGGGIPGDEVDIRLGDVVISVPSADQSGVVEYDLGKQMPDGFLRKGTLCPPAIEWLAVIPKMKSDHRMRSNKVPVYLSQMMARSERLTMYQKPSSGTDVLFRHDYKHDTGHSTCINCDTGMVVDRPMRLFPDEPVVHYGLIASGNKVMKDGIQREKISRDVGGAICFEMEAAGLMKEFSCIVIRGISDYADSHKNDKWQPYAAATAAGVAKEILTYITPKQASLTSPTPVQSRSLLLDEMQAALLPHGQRTPSESANDPLIYVITGIGGIGKSEICLKLANSMRDSFWAIFWVDVSDTSNAARDFGLICQKLNLSESSILGALCALANLRKPWLLILDNADDPEQDISSLIPAGSSGSIIVTSRVPEKAVIATVGSVSLEGLPATEALKLFARSSGLSIDNLGGQDCLQLQELVLELLKCHTLAVIQAGAFIRSRYSTLDSYVRLFRQSATDDEVRSRQVRALQHWSKQEKSRYQSVYNTFEISLTFLEESESLENSDALCLLNMLAVLHHTEFPTYLFRIAWETYDNHQRTNSYRGASSTSVWEHFSHWHQIHLPTFLSLSSNSWDFFRLQNAINKLYNLALLERKGLDGQDAISMHPLIHSWARIRQPQDVRNMSWIQAATTVAHTWRDNLYSQHESFLVAHIQQLLGFNSVKVFDLGPEAEITILLLKCALHLWRQGLFLQMNELIRFIFTSFRESMEYPTRRFIRFHLLVSEFQAIRRKNTRHSVGRLRKVLVLMEDRAPDDHLLLQTKVQLAHSLYDFLDQETISIMEEVVNTARQSEQKWDRDLLVWQVNLAGLYGDDGRITDAIRLLNALIHVERRLTAQSISSLGAVEARQMNDIDFAKQMLRSILIRKKWDGYALTLPLEDRLPELKYRSQLWAGRHTPEARMRSPVMIDYPSVGCPSYATTASPTFHLLLRTGSFREAIRHLQTLQRVLTYPGEPVWLHPGTSASSEISRLIQSASEEAADRAFLENFDFPAMGTDLELDQLRAQHKALEFPGAEISALQKIDRTKVQEHPYMKLAPGERSKYIMEGRWDKLDCPSEWQQLIKALSNGLSSTMEYRPSKSVPELVDFRRQLATLKDPFPPWWKKTT